MRWFVSYKEWWFLLVNKQFIYVHCLGIYVFSNNYEVMDKEEFKDNLALKISLDLCEGIEVSELQVVKAMQKKYSNAKLLEIMPLKVVEFFNNQKTLEKVRNLALRVTKKRIANSVKPDNLLIQAVDHISELDKVINNLSKRLREWYELTNPEFSRLVGDHRKFSELILKNGRVELLQEAGVNEEETMGAELTKEDMLPIRDLAQQIRNLFELRDKQELYIKKIMEKDVPNVNVLCGHMIGAKLIAIAGGIERMVFLPASTVQLLGAESALFRHMKTGAKPPKYGVIVNHPFVVQAKKTNKGKAARALADKISLAVKIDFFKGDFKGNELKKELEEKFKK